MPSSSYAVCEKCWKPVPPHHEGRAAIGAPETAPIASMEGRGAATCAKASRRAGGHLAR